ncbi:SMI1/KNR4 family protein [Streptomyces cyaneochromogenes]|uniref:SMI1/KNR4 family protein n=1 Tax=Streptomyces cyaneochromogenes TaxID=2496836 RepID=A0A3Q9ENJ1_9ACTN|nr:SMI1/KNR4 family protein [Streptomyces cyaneochromogenes]AZQ32312.1 SMI1/KNR4 family protein [Streptomyces cyaneochromogenes]
MWREAATAVFPGVGFREPAQAPELAAAEKQLRRTLPLELRQLLLESNGVIGHTHVDAVWPIDQIVQTNLHFWSDQTSAQLYMPFTPFLFFGDNGGGDQFAFVQTPERPDIFVWEHESDSRRWVANNLQDYLSRALRDGGDGWYQL